MSQFFIRTQDDTFYELTVTETITFSQSASPTSHPVESGVTISDHINIENKTVDFSGIISDIKNTNIGIISVKNNSDGLLLTTGQKGVEDNFIGLNKLFESGEYFSLYFDDRFTPIEFCIFTSLVFDRDKETGQGYRVQMSFQQIQISERAIEVNEPSFDSSVKNQASKKTNGSNNNTEQVKISENLGVNVLSLFFKSLIYSDTPTQDQGQ